MGHWPIKLIQSMSSTTSYCESFSVSAAEPFFCVALRRGDGKWIIEAKWPDVSIEIVETFDDYFEALRWLSTESSAWAEKRTTPKKVG
jgi:hypothetical protein